MSYEALLDIWMLQIQTSHQKTCEKVIEYKKKSSRGNISIPARHSIDSKNDRFMLNMTFSFPPRDVVGDVTSEVANYILWMEHEYHHGTTSSVGDNIRDGWYAKRILWLYRLISILEISRDLIAEKMRKAWMRNRDNKHQAVIVEESIKHFLLSCEQLSWPGSGPADL
ncbi:hypothetical protein LSUE1_G007088 [Lachnellula suecica]|uniref:Uncharacterized protein n=1 Tax=Lachnellula suecica TaxID=602035 RepID=A0A8T9C4S2_9HELO|nr:hypothetical protein LSUE1_G007088 [Lachnellula suecica]